MAKVRWRKLRGDLRGAWGRLLLVQLAMAIALGGVGVSLGTRTVLGRAIRASYLATQPADATLAMKEGIDAGLLAEVRARPDIAAADRREIVSARVKLREEDPWQPFVLFVIDDFDAIHVATFKPEQGAWPPPGGAILVERTAVAVMGLGAGPTFRLHGPSMHGGGPPKTPAELHGKSVLLQTAHGAPRQIDVAGTVHDAGQAPNWQEHRGCGYATLVTLAALGEPAQLHDLAVRFRPDPASRTDVETAAASLATWLNARGHRVQEIRVPTLRQHPHQALMNAVQLVLFAFSILLLVLVAIVLATVLAAILGRQTREIGVMKAVGATTGQLAGMYAVFVLVIGTVAFVMSLPIMLHGSQALIQFTAYMMNITLANPHVPAWVFLLLLGLATLVPLTFASLPIMRAMRVTVRQSLSHSGAGADFSRPSLARLPVALRNVLRRPIRLALTMSLLVVGGALVLTAFNVKAGLLSISSKLESARRHDLEIRLHDAVPVERIADLAKLSGVGVLEAWHATEAALGRPEQAVDIVHTYPDGGHGSFVLVAPPDASQFVGYPIVAGRWLQPTDRDGVVLGHRAAAGVRIGDRLTFSVDGTRSTWTVVGIVEEIGGGSAFVTESAFRRVTGQTGVRSLRFATSAGTPAERDTIIAGIERALAERGIGVQYTMPVSLMRSIIDDHIALVIPAVLVMAAILALVGLIGLGSALSINVAERTREIGIMKTIGAGDGRIFRIFVGEAIAIGALSVVIAALASLPVTLLVLDRIARNGFIAAPPFAFSMAALLGWPVAVIIGCIVASALPARRAARLSVRAALADV
jgi:putative ABC transport system permease protein